MINYLKNTILGDKFQLTSEFEDYLNKFEDSDGNFYLTGNAGTGKSTLINHFRRVSKKNVVVLAPTGLAANNVRGQTIHSFFRLPPKIITPEVIKTLKNKSGIYKELDTIIIDEASMVRADMLDAIDAFMRKFGRDGYLRFGGTQVILVGDLYQLPPVVTRSDMIEIGPLYDSPFFFSSNAYDDSFKTLELTQYFRQSDSNFINILNKIRKGSASDVELGTINTRVTSTPSKTAVTLSTVNNISDAINAAELSKLKGKEFEYQSINYGNFDNNERNLPAPTLLTLKERARVMFTRNGEDWVNGSLGIVTHLDKDGIEVKLDEGGDVVEVPRAEWKHIKYTFDQKSGEISEETVWSMSQYPLKLAYAITVHKSQGMTFDKVNIDYSRSPFAHGQTYVALSRCKSLEGIFLTKKIRPEDIIIDKIIIDFHQ
jgi:ATP-dependent exoDNAse (exonuclease V) alpha subunit